MPLRTPADNARDTTQEFAPLRAFVATFLIRTVGVKLLAGEPLLVNIESIYIAIRYTSEQLPSRHLSPERAIPTLQQPNY